MTEQLTPTSGRDWRKMNEATITTMLPYSGMVVEMGRAQLDQLLLTGKIPDTLTPIVADLLWSSVGQGQPREQIQAEKAFFELVNAVVAACLLSPRVVANPTQDDELTIGDLDFADKLIIYRLATQPLAVLHRFRQEQASGVDTVQQGDDLQPATE